MAIPSDVASYDASGQSYLRTNRLFYVDPTEHLFEGWYFKVRGPRYHGPYQNRRDASAALERMISEYRANKETGGR